jgi:maltose alpha-D-glucosyltransferase/alpha-amylase
MSRRKATSDLWWKNGLFYCLDVQTYLDSDGDGTGDLQGLIERIDYLAGIGVTCLWLMPFFPSPERDDGYDITDFYAVDPRFGTLGDMVELVRTARDRGIRVIADLVVNHTSIRHPWFQDARSSRDSPYRDFYVWRDEKPEEKPGDLVFPDQEDSNWAWDEEAGQWYLHRFYTEQPDLNVANPRVRDELAQIAGFWLQQGLSGFRVDAVPFLLEPAGMPEGAIEDPHELLRDLRAYLGRRLGETVLLGEVNLPPADQRPFFGSDGRRELDLQFNFHAMQAMYLSLAREDATPLEEAASACRRCFTATSGGSGWSTRSRSPCPAPPSSSTARRSGWGRTWRSRGAWPCARPCSGRRPSTAASPSPRMPRTSAAPWSTPTASRPTPSTSRTSAGRTGRC